MEMTTEEGKSMDDFFGGLATNQRLNMSGPLKDLSKEHMLGTTIMAVSYDGGVVMGADSRTSTGQYVANRVSDKISPVTKNIFCLRSGSAADTQAVSDMVAYYMDIHTMERGSGNPPLVKTAATMFKSICYTNKDRLQAGIICAGWDKEEGGSVYSIPLGGALVKQDFSIGGSGSTYIYGYCDANYKKGMSKEECQKFVKTAISHAMARDGSSGGVIRLVTLDKSGHTKEFVEGDKLPFMGLDD
eukprot:gb/GEZN01015157.1/.p1 GENE.gb/GEZN01015157.1/~~gb/GEZN01015157.1/.p1  ORF type:complete len:244 (-),score=39.99 gb/GEZN01015157.1/:181-912(-)